MGSPLGRRQAIGAITAMAAAASAPARAEAAELRLSHGYSVLYLPQMVMLRHQLVEKHLKQMGVDARVSWRMIDGGNTINDAMLSGALDIAAIGTPGFITLWSKTQASPSAAVLGLSGLSAVAMLLSTTNPDIKSLADFKQGDKIAVAGIKTSLPAAILQMMAAKTFGPENYDKLDRYTVGVPYPDATAAMLSGRSEITAHVASPPFSFLERDDPKIHVVANSADMIGDVMMLVTMAQKRFHDANPKLCAAYLAAQNEANRMIDADHKAAAEDYNAVAVTKVPQEMMLKILADRNTKFTTTPFGIQQWATAMKANGSIKQTVTDWRTLFFPEVQGLPGS